MRRSRETVVVIGEGITEKYYIQSLRDVLVIKPTAIKPKKLFKIRIEKML